MMVDPGKVPADNLKALGVVTTKSKMCADASFKSMLNDLNSRGQDFLEISGTTEKWKAYCDGTAVPPKYCTMDSNCDVE